MTYAEKQRIKHIIKKVIFWGVIVYFVLNVAVGNKVTICGGCVSIAFDKWDMMWVDKMIVYVDGETYEITDTDLVREMARVTAVAEYYEGCQAIESERRSNNYTRWIELYVGERMVRRMPWLKNHDWIQVYEADAAHWIFFGNTGVGYVSEEGGWLPRLYEAIGYDIRTQKPLKEIE